MMKHIGLVTKGRLDESGLASFRGEVTSWLGAPDDARPNFAGVGRVRELVGGVAAPYGAVTLARFDSRDQFERWEHWRALNDIGSSVGIDAVVASEVVVRGDDRFESWRHERATKYIHMALATRAPGVTRAAFSERWMRLAGAVQNSRGTTGQRAAAIVIPADLRGEGYIQNHPVLHREHPWDAVNEVWFRKRGLLGSRAAWFEGLGAADLDDSLFGTATFLSVELDVL